MSGRNSTMTDAQSEMVGALDDVAEHVAWEFDPEQYSGPSTCGFARIRGLDGRKTFVKRVKTLAVAGAVGNSIVRESRNGGYIIDVGSLQMRLGEDSYHGGYSLSVTNLADIMDGPEFQRIDVQEEVHRLVLNRLQLEWDMAHEARVTSRID